jgi:prepilin peptidase CpaA
MDHSLQILLLAVFPALVIVGAIKDLTTFTIPNWISLALLGAYFPVALLLGADRGQIGISAAIGFLMLVIGIGMFAARWIGGGDAKLMAAASLWLGWPAIINFVLITALAGGALAVILMTARKTPLSAAVLRGPGWMHKLVEKDGPAPYGVAICFGALASFPVSVLAGRLAAGG